MSYHYGCGLRVCFSTFVSDPAFSRGNQFRECLERRVKQIACIREGARDTRLWLSQINILRFKVAGAAVEQIIIVNIVRWFTSDTVMTHSSPPQNTSP
ncbi:hypothetical protein ASE69_20780 [Sphingomonas sp. Leaf208]|nr:hypothetical protein ASE69_20780 [Sphingomonas sp. Leaf208]